MLAGGGINFRTRNAPYVRVSYELNKQDNEFRKFDINNYHLLTGHSYKTGTWRASTSLNLNYITNSNDSILGRYNANYASLTQSFTTPSMVNLGLSLNRSETEVNSNTTEILGGEITAGFRIARIVRFNIGGSYFNQSVESEDDQSRYGGNAMITVPFLTVFQLSVDARYNSFDSVIDPLLGFEDFYVRTILSASW